METKLNENEVKEIATMQKKIDSYEGFIVALLVMIRSKKQTNYPLFDGTDLTHEMNTIWRNVRDMVVEK